MNLALLIAGIFAVVAGFLSILFGFSVREFSLGSPLIISGTIAVCSGMLLAGLYVVVTELKGLARRLAGAPSEVRVRPVLPGLAASGAAPESMPAAAAARIEGRAEGRIEQPPPPPPAAGPPPWQSEAAARERPRVEAPPVPEAPTPPAAPEAPRRRNLLFASTSRKERERAEAKAIEDAPPQLPAEPGEALDTPPASFDDAWPKPDRMRPSEPPAALRRPPPRSPSTFAEAAPPPAPEPPPPPPPVEQAPVTVLKSGIVDGMAYSLYSDGSIEAQMPEGMMRFASIDELRAHLDQRS
ncbi:MULTISPECIES: hypothetical protein [Bradyrhizobium]|uniref:DUF308 domain-containing protein n=2 Tax=Bradyrhizobium TaxID=374 RepID=A0ABV4FXX3_9BRAD|nr:MULTISPECIES: hypothetical protein [Bradyrhizobium]MBR1289615.1 DUF308 domain-containing protein [Bradyrhizobium ottawaense]MBR1364451.1 DUF308 domain-containing protein [Bradyrhizobium ottawaense]MDA9484714.1 hypothetical protein [Bradyrhizobium sp. CCBAU 11445]PDT67487.1 hypothetical protein CO683_22085 [Bradyrhizobium ottawaense]WLB48687.1 DUF308 domain-containing protein [Bradyrhizobium ottawaense]